MSVPGRVDAVALLLPLDPPAWFLRHSRAVAEIAAWLARRAATRGLAVDRGVVEAAALLHDVDKLAAVRAEDRRLASMPHGDGSALWLSERGHPELAAAVAAHPVVRLADDEWWRHWSSSASPEERIVAYADKRAGQRLEAMSDRFASWRRRYPPEERAEAWTEETLETIRARAGLLEDDVCRWADAAPAEVARLAWTAPAIRAASASGAASAPRVPSAARDDSEIPDASPTRAPSSPRRRSSAAPSSASR